MQTFINKVNNANLTDMKAGFSAAFTGIEKKSRRDKRAEKLHQYVLAHSSKKKYIRFRESSLARAKIRRFKREDTDVMMRDVIFSNSGIKINLRANVRFGGDVDTCFCL